MPTRKRKRQPQTRLPTPQPPQIQGVDGHSRKTTQALTILGLALTAIGLVALIELSPRLSATQQPPFLAGDQVPSVAVSNDGYIRVTDVSVLCFISKMQLGINTVDFMMAGRGSPAQNVLAPTDSYTVSCSEGKFIQAPPSAISHIEVGVVAYYRPWPFTFLRSRKFFRFEGRYDGTKLNWVKQPPNDIDKQFDESMRGIRFP